jgi:hypothetical protein
MKVAILFLLVCYASLAGAQQNYDASLIPKELLPYASAVVRNETISYDVKDLNDVTYHVKRAITVLNKNGDDIAHIVIHYNKLSSVRYIKGVTYNSFGKPTGKFAEKDFQDEGLSNEETLSDDARVKHYIPAVTDYPYTIEYEYEVRNKQTLNFYDWEPVADNNEAVENSSYQFTCKPDFKIRYKEFNLPVPGTVSTNNVNIYSWHISNMKAIREEPYSPDSRKFMTKVSVAPDLFVYYGVPGAFNNWREMGKWIYDKLLFNRDQLPPETIAHVRELTKDIQDPKLKARKIYEYMQQKTHYISVQIGIGGYQPFPASDVDKVNYGDCKALVNYTQALLKAVGINSYYCVVWGYHDVKLSMIPDFTSMQGNHAILCVPFKNDTTWADCTSQTIPFGYLGSFTDDRIALACTPEGGKLLHTPKYTSDQNLESRNAEFVINDKGTLTGTMRTVFKGTEYENREGIIAESETERLKGLKRIYPINNLEVEKLEYKQEKGNDPVTIENMKLNAREYAASDGNSLIFMLNPVNRVSRGPARLKTRTLPVDINRGYTERDEVIYTLPAGYHLDTRALDVQLEKPFGKFSAKSVQKGNQLIYKRNFQLIDGVYSKESYNDLLDFYSDVIDADSYAITLVKN